MGYTWRYVRNLWDASKGDAWEALGCVEGISRIQVEGIFGIDLMGIFGIEVMGILGMHLAVWRESLGHR